LAHLEEIKKKKKDRKHVSLQHEWVQLFQCFSVAAEGRRSGDFETSRDLLGLGFDSDERSGRGSLTMDVVLRLTESWERGAEAD
jgi:hypothetical protein